MTGCDRQGPKRINLLEAVTHVKLDVFGTMKRRSQRQLFGKTYILNPPRWLSMVSALDIHSIHSTTGECHNHSYSIARLHAWLVDS